VIEVMNFRSLKQTTLLKIIMKCTPVPQVPLHLHTWL